MSKLRSALAPLAVLAFALGALAIPRVGADSHAFASGGNISVSVRVGNVHVVSTQSGRIELHYRITPKGGWFHSDDTVLANIELRFDVHGNQAAIKFEDHNSGSHNSSIEVELDVPAQESLDVHTGVGNIEVRRVVGDLRIETGVGNITLAARTGDYHAVEASTGVGDIDGGGFGQGSGFVSKSLSYSGAGKYRLTAHTGVGNIDLNS